ncbi:hypothetical protein OIU76_012760 [Salix suchowensis]|nr:hypothetical protein OIU76_012760 [Salix suchowensis]
MLDRTCKSLNSPVRCGRLPAGQILHELSLKCEKNPWPEAPSHELRGLKRDCQSPDPTGAGKSSANIAGDDEKGERKGLQNLRGDRGGLKGLVATRSNHLIRGGDVSRPT